MIAELSDVAKLDAGAVHLTSQPVNLPALVREVVAQVHEASDRDVHRRCAVAASPCRSRATPHGFDCLFDAIFRAVLRERPGPATVVADCRRSTIDGIDSLVVIVADEPEVQEAARRPRRPFLETRGGLGLAIPLARRVIEWHRGRVEAPQPAEGRTDADDRLARSSAIITIPLG